MTRCCSSRSPAGEVFDPRAGAEQWAGRAVDRLRLRPLRGPRRPGGARTPRGAYRVREVSIGDYVLNGGEVAALAVIEAVGRLLPGVVGNADSLDDESHADWTPRGAGVHQAGDLA